MYLRIARDHVLGVRIHTTWAPPRGIHASNDPNLESYIICRRSMRAAVAGASAARHAAALSRPVRGGVGQLDAAAASQPAAMADGCVAQHVGQVAGKGRMLLVHNSMLKPSRSIKMLTFMLLAAVGRLDGDKRLEERRRNCCKGCCARSSTKD